MMLDLKSKTVNGPVIRLNGSDNVVVARLPIEDGTALEGYNIVTRTRSRPATRLRSAISPRANRS